MARVKITEYAAKSLLMPRYTGVALHRGSKDNDKMQFDDATLYIVRVDQGIKKRAKQGLLRTNVATDEIDTAVNERGKKGYRRFVAEPMFPYK